MKNRKINIYIITNKINGKQYVGQTIEKLSKRFYRHSIAKTYIGNSIRKNGKDKFSINLLAKCYSKRDAGLKEKYYIEKYNTFGDGYNLTLGGEGNLGYVPSEETKRKISNSEKGKIIPKNVRNKMSISHMGDKNIKYWKNKCGQEHPRYGTKHSEKTIEKMKKNHCDCSGAKNSMYGRKHSKEAILKMSIKRKEYYLRKNVENKNEK